MGFGQTSGSSANNLTPDQKEKTFKITNVNANAAQTDVGQFTGLPARYFITNLYFFEPSAPMQNATFDLMPLPNGQGDHLITQFRVNALSDPRQYTPAVLAIAGAQTLRTESVLYLRNITPEGTNKTLSAMLEVQEI